MPQDTSRGYTYPLYGDASSFPSQIQTLATDFDTDIQSLITRVVSGNNQPACSVEGTVNQAIANNTDVTVTYATELYDNAAMVNLGVSTTTITFPESGIYIACFRGSLASNANAGGRQVAFVTTGPLGTVARRTIPGETGVAVAVAMTALFSVNAANTMTVVARQNSGASLNLVTRRLQVAKVSEL